MYQLLDRNMNQDTLSLLDELSIMAFSDHPLTKQVHLFLIAGMRIQYYFVLGKQTLATKVSNNLYIQL
jgi:hypothetical protein